LLGPETIVVAGRKGDAALAAIDEGGNFSFVGGPEAVDELGGAGAAESAGEDPPGDGFGCTAAAVDFDQRLVCSLCEMADPDLALVPIDDRFDAIACNMIAGDLHLRGKIVAEPHAKQGVVKIFDGSGEGVTIKAGTESEGAGGHLASEPQDFVDIVDGHVGQDAVALVAVGGGGGVLESGVDFEDATDQAGVHALFAVGDSGIKAPLEGEHEGVGRIAVEFSAEGNVAFERAGEGLFKNNPMAGADNGGSLLAMFFSGGDDHGGGRDAGGEISIQRGKNPGGAAGFKGESLGRGRVDIDERSETAEAVLAFEFEEMAGVDGAHATEADDADFERVRHECRGNYRVVYQV